MGDLNKVATSDKIKLSKLINPTDVTVIIRMASLTKIAKACRRTVPTVRMWCLRGELPMTELTGETEYYKILLSFAKKLNIDTNKKKLLQRNKKII